MSTENEGASVPSAAEPRPGSLTSPPAEAPAPADAQVEERTAQLPAVDSAVPVAPATSAAPAAPVALEKEAPVSSGSAAPAEPAAAPVGPAPVDPAAAYGAYGQTPPPAPEAQTAQFPAGPPQPAYNATGVPMHGAPDAGQWYGGAAAPPPYGAAPWGAPTPPPRRGRSGGLVAAVLAAALVAGGVGGGIGFWAAKGSDDSSTTVSSSGDPKVESRTPGSVADIASKALPSVVTIEAQSSNGEGGTGTGFVYDTQGHILTNNHVVASAADSGKLSVTFSDGKSYDAEVLGRAQGYDVAVIKLKNPSGAKLNPLPLGDSDKAAVGDATVAIGAPFGLSGTVTTGIVSAKKRPVASSDGGSGGQASYMSALQTDASINPGNSGGPLLNAQGAVIGINSAIQSAGNGGGGFGGGQGQSGSIGLGFAIPINQAKNVAQQLMKDHTPIYPVISATVNMKDNVSGARIASGSDGGSSSVTPGGPADKAGLKPGDVIIKLDDTTIDSGPTLISEIWTHKPGDKVTVTYVRDGKQATTEITLGERRGDKAS
ncbi:S1C family serine protease [Streptomyces hesseae]|uniref:Trypsin-like peptidase domain-containing protein n=1 Tax=Streptomyces hesseae TaxID=3075519 RepID=A0ABU2SSH0_9ACTN|nr:trypsin-like peptidase domain-containing protein [Streptomyces sp. DSM 40473]MDT0451943.1 trypsin-like peptidase domain-containing protein [Streptomyces sp. DSM 40473]